MLRISIELHLSPTHGAILYPIPRVLCQNCPHSGKAASQKRYQRFILSFTQVLLLHYRNVPPGGPRLQRSPYLKFSMLTCGHEACSRVNSFLRFEETETMVPLDDKIQRCVTGLRIGQRYSLFNRDICWSRKPPHHGFGQEARSYGSPTLEYPSRRRSRVPEEHWHGRRNLSNHGRAVPGCRGGSRRITGLCDYGNTTGSR